MTIFASIVFALSVPCYLVLVDWIWLKELDENNELIAERIENEFNNQNISNEKLAESITFWNEIQPGSNITYVEKPLLKDSTYTFRRQNPYTQHEDIDRFRGLMTNITINGRQYVLTVETNVEETEETVAYIAMTTLLFFMVLVIGFWVLNRQLSQKLWQPFQDTLQKLKSFQLNKQATLQFSETDIVEFHELNTALDKLLKNSIATYRHQKEFTENASHELQTPLAIIKNKLDLLLQKEAVTVRQYQIIEEINKALTRIVRINRNLLSLAKIENKQFDDSENVSISLSLFQCIKQLQEHAENKNIPINTQIKEEVIVEGNATLVEMLITNLLLNAIRHTMQHGEISVTLNETQLIISNSGLHQLNSITIFQRFSKTSPVNSGSGLGLAIVEQICKRHNWSIEYLFKDGSHVFVVGF